MTLVIIIAIFLGFFAAAYITKRRYGVLALGLAAGVLLAQNISRPVAEFLALNSFPVAPLTYGVTATIILIVLPAVLLLAKGPTHEKKLFKLSGSLLFAILATLLVVGPLTTILPTHDDTVKQMLVMVADWQDVVVAGAIAIAVADTILLHSTKTPAPSKSSKR